MNFTYSQASSTTDAAKRRKKKESAYLAGGMSILPTLKLGLNEVSELVDLNKIKSIKGIKKSAKQITVGAMTRHADVASSAEVKATIPALADLAAHIGDPQVRNRGTIGGSIANFDPAADYPAACLGLGATIVTDKREIPADKFFLGLFETALKPGELVTAVKFPVAEKAAYVKFPNPASRFALVGVFVAKTGGAVRVAVTGAGRDGAYRATDMETALARSFTDGALDAVKVDDKKMASDIHAAADYRAHLVKVMAKRAVAACG